MSQRLVDAGVRTRVLLVATVAGLVAAVLPGLVAGSTLSSGTAVAVLALVLAAMAGLAGLGVALAVHALPGATAVGHVEPPALRGRATDPTHHPLCPRAPGLA